MSARPAAGLDTWRPAGSTNVGLPAAFRSCQPRRLSASTPALCRPLSQSSSKRARSSAPSAATSAAIASSSWRKALAQQPWRGTVDWDPGAEGLLPCRLRTLRATIRFSRTGRTEDVQEALVNFVAAVPLEGRMESLVLATTLPVDTVAQ